MKKPKKSGLQKIHIYFSFSCKSSISQMFQDEQIALTHQVVHRPRFHLVYYFTISQLLSLPKLPNLDHNPQVHVPAITRIQSNGHIFLEGRLKNAVSTNMAMEPSKTHSYRNEMKKGRLLVGENQHFCYITFFIFLHKTLFEPLCASCFSTFTHKIRLYSFS